MDIQSVAMADFHRIWSFPVEAALPVLGSRFNMWRRFASRELDRIENNDLIRASWCERMGKSHFLTNFRRESSSWEMKLLHVPDSERTVWRDL
jgi:hypothetical protein